MRVLSARQARARSVRGAGDERACHRSSACRRSSTWAVNVSLLAGQGHDAAVHLLWRLVAHRHGLRDGAGAGLRARRAGVAVRPIRLAAGGGLRRAHGAHARAHAGSSCSPPAAPADICFPAQALAEALIRRGYVIHLMTDERVRDYGRSFPALETHLVPPRRLSLVQAACSCRCSCCGCARLSHGARRFSTRLQARRRRRLRRLSVVPAGLAASRLRIPSLHP